MSVNTIDNAKTTNVNLTRETVFTIYKYTLTNTSNTIEINQQQQAWGTDKYENAHILAATIEFSRILKRESCMHTKGQDKADNE